jgi:hypothetical protein
MVKSWTTLHQELFGAGARKRLLLIFRPRIFDSSVERGIPSRAAAPKGPNTRPPLARRASSTIAFQAIECPFADQSECLPGLPRVATDEVLHQHGNVFPPFPQRRHLERKHVEPIKEILTERSVGHRCRQAPIGRGDDANIDLDPLSSSHPLE